MKTIRLQPTEFWHFRQLAFAMGIAFACTIAQGVYIVEANIDQLHKLGYQGGEFKGSVIGALILLINRIAVIDCYILGFFAKIINIKT